MQDKEIELVKKFLKEMEKDPFSLVGKYLVVPPRVWKFIRNMKQIK